MRKRKNIQPTILYFKNAAGEITEDFKVFTGRKKAEEIVRTTLLSFIEIFQDRYKNKFTSSHLRHYNGLKMHLEDFQNKKGFRVDFDTIGRDFYLKFTNHLKEKGLKPNTISAHIKRVKRLMNEAIEDKLTTNQEHHKREFKIIKEDVDGYCLPDNK
ncbi:MAG: phage integrase SAM-like domain-containing protein [Bacteroidales bacterium]|nr:phage integrase SAM-like domain-containing protein [Bacteroidales bacterium]